MLKSDKIEKFKWLSGKMDIKINKEYNTVKVGDYFFSSLEDFNRFVNKLSDIAEEFIEEDSDEV